MSCTNCGVKGHIASECTKSKVAFKDRPCFKCQKPGHISKDCPMSGPVKAIMDGPVGDNSAGAKVREVFCITGDDDDDDDNSSRRAHPDAGDNRSPEQHVRAALVDE